LLKKSHNRTASDFNGNEVIENLETNSGMMLKKNLD